MDDLEFRKRAFSNPLDSDQDFATAASTDPTRLRLLDELSELENRLAQAIHSVAIPEGLAEKLKKNLVENPADADSPAIAAAVSEDAFGKKPPASKGAPPSSPHPEALPRPEPRRPYLLAASVLAAAGLTFTVGLQGSRPSAQDMAFHDSLIDHVLHEEYQYSADDAQISWEQMAAVISAAGGTLHDNDSLKRMQMKYAGDCDLGSGVRGAHIVLAGEKGPVSVIFVDNAPVRTDFKMKDERFHGKIIPLDSGNLAIIGEKDEPIESYESLISESFEWQI